jgi:hypothetical protein
MKFVFIVKEKTFLKNSFSVSPIQNYAGLANHTLQQEKLATTMQRRHQKLITEYASELASGIHLNHGQMLAQLVSYGIITETNVARVCTKMCIIPTYKCLKSFAVEQHIPQ